MKLAGKFDPLLARGKRRVRADVDTPNNPPNRTAAVGSPPPPPPGGPGGGGSPPPFPPFPPFDPEALAMNPALSTLGAGAAAAGLATLGNVVTGQAQEKSPGRLIAEALGAGALGAGVGATLGPGYMNRLVKAGSTSPKAEFALGTGIGVLGAGALGGAIGGGIMNVVQGEDPERYGSSNTLMARTATPTLQYM
jgi:hypothetical protein